MFEDIRRRASLRYASTGTIGRRFAGGKLKGDPIYRELLLSGALHPGRLLVDVGCGQGLALAGLAECRNAAEEGRWTASRPAPAFERMVGIELRPRIAAIARRALGSDAEIVTGDAAGHLMPANAAAVLLLDVLHLMPRAAQETVVARAAAALEPGGVLVLREADASAGARFLAVRFGNRVKALAVGNFRQGFHFRTAEEWRARLAGEGLRVDVRPMGTGTPFGNVLLLARR